jgi:uncharacterized membrane protein YczE
LALLIVFIFADRYISIFTVVVVLFLGIMLDFGTWIYHILLPSLLISRIIMAVFGFFFVCCGVSMLIVVDIGQDALTGVQLLLKDATHKSYRMVKTALDIILLILGVVMGGLLGPITIIEACFMGAVVQKFVTVIKKHIVF